MKFFQWGERRPDRDPQPEKKRGTANRERLIAKMASYADEHDRIQHMAGDDDTKTEHLARLRAMYHTLRDVVSQTSFATSALDDLVGVIYNRELLATDDGERSTIETIRLSLTMDDGIAPTIIRNLSHSVPDRLRVATGYGSIVNGNGETIAYLPTEKNKRVPLYLGSSVRYSTKKGESGLARIERFADPKGVYEDPDQIAFHAIPQHDTGREAVRSLPLRFSEIVDIYDE